MASIEEPLEDEIAPEERVNIAVYEMANRSVVNICTKSTRPDAFFFGEVPEEGSGWVFDKQEHVLTNYHVIEGAWEVRVTVYDGQEHLADLVSYDPPNDIAVLRITAPPETLHPLKLGNSSRLKVWQKVYDIGNPFALERTLTVVREGRELNISATLAAGG